MVRNSRQYLLLPWTISRLSLRFEVPPHWLRQTTKLNNYNDFQHQHNYNCLMNVWTSCLFDYVLSSVSWSRFLNFYNVAWTTFETGTFGWVWTRIFHYPACCLLGCIWHLRTILFPGLDSLWTRSSVTVWYLCEHYERSGLSSGARHYSSCLRINCF